MNAGMILRSKRAIGLLVNRDKQWFIKKEGELKRHTKNKFCEMVKGYLVAPLEDLENGFWVSEEQLHKRFEEDV